LIPGRVVKFNYTGLKIPHVGWNKLSIKQKHGFLKNLEFENLYVYFVHSYHALTPEEFIVATSNYGVEFPAIATRDNIIGTQFHPEKSGLVGLKMIKNFVEICDSY
ncbi:MAG: imidazole glycerol phosphate synthase subunit HisH, partial [Halobacteria archaeon]